MGEAVISGHRPTLDAGLARRLWIALGGSVAAHAVALALWALTYDPEPVNLEPTERRVVKAIALTKTPRPAPAPEPQPRVEPEPEPEPEPPAEDVSEQVEATVDRPRGPPPPPAPCRNCALMPSALGVPKDSRSKTTRAIPWGVAGGVPGGVVGGVPGGIVGGVVGGDPSAIGAAASSSTRAQRAEPPKPLAAVMQRAIFTPEPDPKALAKTKAAMFDRRRGVNRTAFCVDTRGKTTAVRTTTRFGGDPQIDQLCREAVKRWRFHPFLVAGRPRRVCSVVVFELEFE